MHGSERLIVSAAYLGGAAWLLARGGGAMRRLLVDGFRTPYRDLVDAGVDQG